MARPEFARGARNAVRACLNIGEQDRVFVIRDRGRADIADAIEVEARATGATVRAWTMEDHLQRPATSFPRDLGEELTRYRPTASFYIGTGMRGELAFRQPMLHLLADDLRARHGHMIGINDVVMTDGMAADYDEVYAVTRKVYEIVRQAARISVTTSLGTDLVAIFSPTMRWVPCDGRYWEQGRWGNLPEGETFTCPASVDGVLAAEELGDWFTDKYGLLSPPLRLVIRGGRVVAIETPDDQLRADVREYLGQHPNSNRVGEFAIGTNVALTQIVGNFLQDE